MEISFRGNRHLIANERGQSLLEYILILFVSVALILGLIFEFSSAFKVWANNYFGDYLTCLLETGELPSIGGSPGDSGTCNQFFQPFSLKNGRPSNALAKGKGGSGQSSARPSGLNRAGVTREGAIPNGNHGGGWNSNGGSSNSSRLADTSENGGAGGAAKTGDMSLSSGGGYTSRNSTKLGGDGGRQLNGRIPILIKKEKEQKTGYSTSAVNNDFIPHTPKRIKVKPPRQPASQQKDEPMTFGNFLRYLIIAAIIIALVVVIGGQLLQAIKGMDAAD